MTPQEMIQFITTRYDSKKGIRRRLFGDSMEIKSAKRYLESLNNDVSVLEDKEIFLTLVTHFLSKLYAVEHLENRAVALPLMIKNFPGPFLI